MAEITLVKQMPLALSEAESAVLRRVMFGCMDGMAEQDKKGWRRFWNSVMKSEVGEMFRFTTKFQRNGRFHRKMFVLLNLGYEVWAPPRKHRTYKGFELQKNFDQFREDIVIAAGFFERTFDMKGRMKLRAKSLSYAKMDDDEFGQVYNKVLDTLLESVMAQYGGRDDVNAVVDRLMEFH